MRRLLKSLTFPPLSIARYSFKQLSQLGRQWRERKCPIFETVAKGDSNPRSLDCESGILPQSYRTPHGLKAKAGRKLKAHNRTLCFSETLAYHAYHTRDQEQDNNDYTKELPECHIVSRLGFFHDFDYQKSETGPEDEEMRSDQVIFNV